MFVHTVYFWLQNGTSEEDKKKFIAGVETLKNISAATACYIGTPADTHRAIIDRSYDVALTVICKDKAAHDEYQVDPIHLKFVENFQSMFGRVLIYDAD